MIVMEVAAAQSVRRWLRRRARRRRWRHEASRFRSRPLSLRGWLGVWIFVVSATVVMAGLYVSTAETPTEQSRIMLARLGMIPVLAQRPPHRDDYDRAAFGMPWTDQADVVNGHNGCDTRNDILARDLTDIRTGPTSGCAHAVISGELRSPYTGGFVAFRRGRNSAAIQIDHIVPLSFAWDMGANNWSATQRANLANDPANLVAVDGTSNMDKSDQEPGRWMPPAKAFHCQYATQFVAVLDAYRLYLDVPSRDVLARVLHGCFRSRG
ncbi:HNH endonuclease family protein [Gordonia sp. CPCC 205333]|uniref:HNH endonuclease family protein n=1 Tax=Gordonia sp. CPCC 205333 TaxID=3140790 RepID=UPI003AF3D1C2